GVHDAVEDQLSPDLFFHRLADAAIEPTRRQRLGDVAAARARREQGMAPGFQRDDAGRRKGGAEMRDSSNNEASIADEAGHDVLAVQAVLQTDDGGVGRNEADNGPNRRLVVGDFRGEQDHGVPLDRTYGGRRSDRIDG